MRGWEPRAFPEPLSSGRKHAGGTLASKDSRLQGDVSPEGLPLFSNNFMAPGSAASLSPAQPPACGLHLEPGRRQPLRLAQGLDLGTPRKDPRRRVQIVGGRRTEC